MADLNPQAVAIPQFNIQEGTRALGMFWPGLFIVIACGAVSGFHSLCAGGTTCKQITTEKAARQIGYYGMLLESFLAVCVIGVLMVGAIKADYVIDVHPKTLGGLPGEEPNYVLGFAVAVGNAAKLAYGVPIAVGALAVEEDQPPGPARPVATSGLLRRLLQLLRLYWFNSAIAVGLMLAFALTGGQKALWKIFATSNQLLAAMVLAIASLWLLRQGRRLWFAFVPGVLMLVTTVTNLILMLRGFLAAPGKNATLLAADVLILAITIYLVVAGVREAVRSLSQRLRVRG